MININKAECKKCGANEKPLVTTQDIGQGEVKRVTWRCAKCYAVLYTDVLPIKKPARE